ncbi:MAG: glycosyltransferase family 9 protein, partial [Planctomycetota bacterium]
MPADWLILHAGALGDLVLTIQLALRLPGAVHAAQLNIISRSNPGDLSDCQPHLIRQAADGLGLHWLYTNTDAPPPDALRKAVRRRRVLNALDDQHSVVHQHLAALAPAELWSFDPRPRPDSKRHITQQWQTDLEAQGLLVPKCIHQHLSQRCLGVPESLRQRGHEKLHAVGCDQGTILIHPGSGGHDKCWPLARFLDVARQLEQNRQPVCFLIGPVELE